MLEEVGDALNGGNNFEGKKGRGREVRLLLWTEEGGEGLREKKVKGKEKGKEKGNGRGMMTEGVEAKMKKRDQEGVQNDDYING